LRSASSLDIPWNKRDIDASISTQKLQVSRDVVFDEMAN
jgi:hypothetical protein